jgi:hypothetical protein
MDEARADREVVSSLTSPSWASAAISDVNAAFHHAIN